MCVCVCVCVCAGGGRCLYKLVYINIMCFDVGCVCNLSMKCMRLGLI